MKSFIFLLFAIIIFNSALSCAANNEELVHTLNPYGNSYLELDQNGNQLLIIKNIVNNINDKSNATIIDIGSGYGAFSVNLIKLGISQVYSIDIEPKHLSYMVNNYPNDKIDYKNRIIPIQGSFLDEKLIDKKIEKKGNIDAIFLINVIHFWSTTEINNALSRVFKLLKPGGLVYIQVTNWQLQSDGNVVDHPCLKYNKLHKKGYLEINECDFHWIKACPVGNFMYWNYLDVSQVALLLYNNGFHPFGFKVWEERECPGICYKEDIIFATFQKPYE